MFRGQWREGSWKSDPEAKEKEERYCHESQGRKEFQDERDESTTSNIESSTKTRNQIIGSSNSESLVTVV